MEDMRIVIIGAGAIGGISAALIKQKGYDVSLVCKHQVIADIASGRGLHIKGVCGEHTVNMKAVTDLAELQGVFDIAIIATKAYDMQACAKELLSFLKEDSLVLSFQNGICTDDLAAIVGHERTVGCVIGWGATMLEEGELEMTSTGEFIIGCIEGDQSRLLEVKDALDAIVPTEISDDITSELYSKLIVNSCITSLGAICGLRLGKMLKMKQARNIFIAIIKEAMEVADALGLKVPPFGGKLNYENLVAGDGMVDSIRRHMVISVVGLKYHSLKSSSLQSLERGRPTEIDYFNGFIVRKGEEVGVDCPVNRRLVTMIKEIEGDKRSIKIDNLYDQAFTQRHAAETKTV